MFPYYLDRIKIVKRAGGFTLVEVLVTVAIFALIMAALSVLERNVFSLNSVIQNSLVAQGEIRKALSTMVAETRPLSLSSIGSYPITEASSTSFTLYSDADGNGLVERIRYFTSGTTLQKGVLKPTGSPATYNPANETVVILVHNMVNGATPVFDYYDANYSGSQTALAQPVSILSVRLVKVTLMVDPNPGRSPVPLIGTTQITLRNLKDNL